MKREKWLKVNLNKTETTMENKEPESSFNTGKAKTDIDKVFRQMERIARISKFIVWLFKWGIFIFDLLFATCISAWIGLILVFIWSEDIIYIKYFFTLPIIGFMCAIPLFEIDKFLTKKSLRKKYNDGSKIEPEIIRYKLLRHVMFFAVGDEITHEKLKLFFTDEAIIRFKKDGFIKQITE